MLISVQYVIKIGTLLVYNNINNNTTTTLGVSNRPIQVYVHTTVSQSGTKGMKWAMNSRSYKFLNFIYILAYKKNGEIGFLKVLV